MSNTYSDVDETDRLGLDSTKNRGLEQSPMTAVQKRRAALEELDEAKFSVCTLNDNHRRFKSYSLTTSGSTLEHVSSLVLVSLPTHTISSVFR